jgi:hypothetical protein
VNALVQVVEQYGDPDDVSREAITAALGAAEGIDMYGLIPDWTRPTRSSTARPTAARSRGCPSS